MKVLIAPTEDFIKYGRSTVAADAPAGSNIDVELTNATEFTGGGRNGDFIVIGREGSDTAELVQIESITDNTVTIATLVFAHKADEPVVKYRYNERKFYGCTTIDGTFSELVGDGSPKAITVNDPQGTLLEYTGGEGYLYFKATYYNSSSSEESNLPDATAVSGDESVRYCSIHAIKVQAGLTKNPYITDDIVETYRKRAENEVDSYLNARYILPLMNSQSVEEIPFMVENCATLLAAGYMDYQEYGGDGQGVKWLGQARGILTKLQTPGGQQLLGSDRQEMQTKVLSNGVQGYPNTVDNCNGPAQNFTMQQRF